MITTLMTMNNNTRVIPMCQLCYTATQRRGICLYGDSNLKKDIVIVSI